MKKSAVALLLISSVAYGCIDYVGPSTWHLIGKDGQPMPLTVERFDKKLFLQIWKNDSGTSNAVAAFNLIKPQQGFEWVYGACSKAGKEDPVIFAYVKSGTPWEWAPEVIHAYRINSKALSLEELKTQGIKCYLASTQ